MLAVIVKKRKQKETTAVQTIAIHRIYRRLLILMLTNLVQLHTQNKIMHLSF